MRGTSAIVYVKWIIIVFLGIFILFGLPLIIYYQVVKPKLPTFTVHRASIPFFNLTQDGHLIAFFDIHIRVHNPNHKLKLKYRHVRVSVFKDKQNLGTDALPGFTQRKGNVTVLMAEPVTLNVSLKKGPAFNFGFERGMGYLEFDVFMRVNLNNWRKLKVNCKHIVVSFDGTQKFQSKSCSVSVKTTHVVSGRTK